MGKLRPAGINPRCQPIGTYVRRRVGQLSDQNHRRRIIEVIEILIIVRILANARIAIRQQYCFEPAVSAEASLKGVVGGVADVRGVVWAHGEKDE